MLIPPVAVWTATYTVPAYFILLQKSNNTCKDSDASYLSSKISILNVYNNNKSNNDDDDDDDDDNTVEPRYNDPRYNVIPRITMNILCPSKSYSKMYETELR